MKKIALILFALLGAVENSSAQCGLDIYVLNDNSGSVDAVEYQQSKAFITTLATEFLPLGTANNQTRMAIGDWSDANSFTQFDFPNATSQYTTEFSDIVYYESAPRILNGATDINDAVEEASQVAGLPVIPGRNVPQVLVILTDAYDYQVSPGIIPFANNLKNQGFEIIVMAIDEAVFDPELPQVASSGAYFTAGDYQTLQDDVLAYAQNLATQACTFDPPTPRPNLDVTLTNFTIENCLTTPTASVDYLVNNLGSESFSGDLYISFYDADPTTPSANLVGVYNAGATFITSGGATSGTITNADVTGLIAASTLYAIVNFNGNQPGNEVPVSAVLAESQLATTTPEAEQNTINNFSSGIIADLETGCDVAILDMEVTVTGGGCEDEATYTVQICNNGLVDAALNDLTVDQASGFNLLSSSDFCGGTNITFSQLGQDLTGDAPDDDFFVSALSTDGYTIVSSGLVMDNGAITDAGGTKIYDYNQLSGQWVQRGQTIFGPNAGDWVGYDNDITSNGNRIVIGGHGYNSRYGAIYVYDWNGGAGQWQQVGNTIYGNASNDDLKSVAISGDGQRIIVSARNGIGSEGRVEVYELIGNTWTQMGTDFIGSFDDNLGDPSWPKAIDISYDGTRIFMGGFNIDAGGLTNNGQVRIYDWNGSSWIATPFVNGLSDNTWDGWGVSATPDGTVFASFASVQSGSDYFRVFSWNGSAWLQKGNTITRPGIYSIDISETGNRLAVGRPSGGNELYEFDGSQWVLVESFSGVAGFNSSINGNGSVVAFGDETPNSYTGLIQVYQENPCLIAPGECFTATYTYDVSSATAGTYDFDVVLDAGPADPSHADPIINPDKNFTTQNTAATGDGWDGANHSEDDVTIYSSTFCSSTHTIDIAVSMDPASVCEDGYATATVTITNPYPNDITGTNLVLDLGNGATYASEPYNRAGIVLPTFPGLDGTTGSNTIPVYSLASGINTFDVDIAVTAGVNTLTVQLTNIDPAYNNGSATTAQVSDDVNGQSNPTITGTCPGDVTSGTSTISLNYSVSGASSILWTSGTNGTFSNPNAGSTTYTITPQDEANGFVNFALNAQSSAGCDNTIICRVNITDVDRDYGDAPITFDLNETTIPVAAAHTLLSGLYLGNAAPDAEVANQPSVNADTEAEDDGLVITTVATVGATTYGLPITVTNTTGNATYANAFIDWDENGNFLGAMESGTAILIPAASGTQDYTVNFDVPSGIALNTPLYVRLRVAEVESSVDRSYGVASGGEVEDFYLLATAACVAGDNAPVISGINFDPQPTTAGELVAAITVNNQPANTVISVHTSEIPTDANRLSAGSPLSAGTTYYIAFWDEDGECYSPTTEIQDCPLIDHEPFIYHLYDEFTGDPNNTQQLYKQLYYGELPFICPTATGCDLNDEGELYAATNITGTISNLAYGDSKYYVVDENGDLLLTSNLVEGNFVNTGDAQISSPYVNLAYDNGVFYRWDRVGATNSVELYSSTDPVGLGWTLEGGMSLSFSYTEGAGANQRTYQLADMAAHDGVFHFMYYTTDVSTSSSGNANRTRTFSSSTPLTTPNGGWTSLGTSYFGYGVSNIAFGGEDVFAACGIEVCPAGDEAPNLAETSFDPAPETVGDLIALLSASNMPAETQFSIHLSDVASYSNRMDASDSFPPGVTTYYVAFWNQEYECYSPATAVFVNSSTCFGPDADGDGVPDMCDLDADNDGILDIDENCNVFLAQNSSGTWIGKTPSTLTVSKPGASNQATVQELVDGKIRYHINQSGAEQRIISSGNISYTYSFSPPVLAEEVAFYMVDLDPQFAGASSPTYQININGGAVNGAMNSVVYGGSAPYLSFNNTTGLLYVSDNSLEDYRVLLKGTGNTLINEITIVSTGVDPGDVVAYTLLGLDACDTDNDGVPNYLDLDSDNDGCPDAIEGDENVTVDQLNPDVTVNSTVDTDGVPSLVNMAGSADLGGDQGQGVGASQDDADFSACCPSSVSGWTDSDGDGVSDRCDLDDDNDGILDSEECPAVYIVSPVTTSSVTVNGTITSGTAQQLVDGEGAGGSGAGPFPYWYTNETNLPLEFSMDMQTPSTIDHIKLYYPWGIDEWVSEFTVEMYDNSNVLLGVENLTAPDQYSGAPILSFSQEYADVSSIEFTIVSGQEYNSFDRVSLNEIVFLDLQTCDTDNDGTPDYLDLDSDGDGCYDALEGDENVTHTDLNPDGSINAAVDADGVPISVNATGGADSGSDQGQGIGASQDNMDFSTCCPSSVSGWMDSDGDGVSDRCDLDDDNDGIMDTVECSNTITDMANAFAGGTLLDIAPSDFGLALNAKNQDVTADLSDKFGYSANSGAVIISISNASVHPTEDAWWTKDGEQPSVWNVTGSLSAFVLMAQDTRYYGDDSKTIHIYDAAPVLPIMLPGQENQTAIAGQWSIIDTPTQKTLNDLDNNTLTNEFGNWRFANMNFGPKTFGFSTTTTFGDPTYAVLMYLECDADMDGIPNRLDLDSDNDSCLDAIEGDGSFTETDMVTAGGTVTVGTGSTASNENLCADGSCVDVDGIPTVAGTGQGVGLSQNAAESGCYCTQPGLAGTATEFTQIGVSDRNGDAAGWPGTIPNGFLAMESEDSGFVITRVAQVSDIANPVEGMLVYDIADQCVKLFNGTDWHCLERTCN